MTLLRWIDIQLVAILRIFILVALAIILFLVVGDIVVRFVPVLSMSWYEEILQFCFAWMIFLGAALLWRKRELFSIDLLQHMIPGIGGRIVYYGAELLSLAFVSILALKGWQYVALETETTPFLALPRAYWYAALPVGSTLMTVYSVVGLVAKLRPPKTD